MRLNELEESARVYTGKIKNTFSLEKRYKNGRIERSIEISSSYYVHLFYFSYSGKSCVIYLFISNTENGLPSPSYSLRLNILNPIRS